MNILFFGPFNYRSRDNESVMLQLKKLGHKVLFLTSLEGNLICDFLSTNGIDCYKMNTPFAGPAKILGQIFFLIRFIKKHKISAVFSHLEPANFVAVVAQRFVGAKIFIVRHHSDLFFINGFHNQFSYRYTYQKARHIIAVSNHAKTFMADKEGVDRNKVSVIDLSYDFELFDKPDLKTVQAIKDKYSAKLLFLSAGRLVRNKRFDLSVEVVNRLKESGLDVKLVIIGQGGLEKPLLNLIEERNMAGVCALEGFRENVMDYLAACDILLHPSESESSSVIIKEAGIQRKVVIACKGVGDCDEYIVNGQNGFLVDKDDFANQATDIIEHQLSDPLQRLTIGKNLFASVKEKFDVEKNIRFYEQLLNE